MGREEGQELGLAEMIWNKSQQEKSSPVMMLISSPRFYPDPCYFHPHWSPAGLIHWGGRRLVLGNCKFPVLLQNTPLGMNSFNVLTAYVSAERLCQSCIEPSGSKTHFLVLVSSKRYIFLLNWLKLNTSYN